MTSLGDLVEITGGGTPSRKNVDYWDGEIFWATVKDFKSFELNSAQEKITPEGLENSASNFIPAGSIIVPTRMAVGKAAINTVGMAINQDLKALQIKDNKVVDRDYLFRALLSQSAYLESRGKGATVKGITLDVLRELKIPLPPIKEQKRIAAILDKADAIRRKRQQAIDLTDQLLRSIFLEMFGDSSNYSKRFNFTELNDLSPKITDGEHGTVKRLDSGRLYLMARNITRDNKVDLNDVSYISEEDHNRIFKRCNAEQNDLLLVCVGATIGKVALVPDMEEFSLARSVALIKTDPKIINPKFLLHLFKSSFIKRELLNRSNTSAQSGLYTGQIKSIKIPCPNVSEQNKFADFVDVVERMRGSSGSYLGESINLFNSLTQQAFNGQLSKPTQAA